MKKNALGNTSYEVTELCFGALPMGPLQLNVDLASGAALIREAVEAGINFIDTAQGYRTYPYIRRALDGFDGKVRIATKSNALTYEDMAQAVTESLDALDRKSIDIFHLHAARATPAVFDERAGAFRCLLDYREKGIIGAVGISTHSVATVAKAATVNNVDVIFPIINYAGFGLLHGSTEEMESAIAVAHDRGKGVYAMKALGGGNLIKDVEGAFNYVRGLKGVASVAVGMVNVPELRMNLDIFLGRPVKTRVPLHTKSLFIQRFCVGCATCVDACPNHALAVVDGKAVVDRSRCITCGYCAPSCPQFAIRLV